MMKHKETISIIKTEQRASVVENLKYISIPCVSIICVLRPRKTEGKRRDRDRQKKFGEKIIKKPKHINKSKVIGILKNESKKKEPNFREGQEKFKIQTQTHASSLVSIPDIPCVAACIQPKRPNINSFALSGQEKVEG